MDTGGGGISGEENEDFLEGGEGGGGEGGGYEDSACALCRKCQMRKRLEKKVAERNVMRSGPEAEGNVCLYEPRQALSGVALDGLEDTRSIDELLSYINGGREGSENEQAKVKKARSRRKSKRGQKGQEKRTKSVEDAVERQSDPSTILSDLEATDDNNQREDKGAGSVTARAQDSAAAAQSEQMGELILQVYNEPAEDGNKRPSKQGDTPSLHDDSEMTQHGGGTETDLPSDLEEEIDREVEDFRRRLAEASASFVGDRIKPVSIIDFTTFESNNFIKS